MERQLGAVRAQLKTLDIAAKEDALGKMTDPLKRQRAELTLQRDKLLLSKSALDKTGGASRRAGLDADFFVLKLHAMLNMAQIVGGALEKMGHAAVGLGRSIGEAVNFKESSMIGLRTFFGADAGNVFGRMETLAARTGHTSAELVGLAKSLGMAGYASKEIDPIVKRLTGLNNISAGAGDKVAGVLESLRSTGKGSVGDIEGLRGTPINVEKLYEDLAVRYGGKPNRLAGKALATALSGTLQGIPPELLTNLIFKQADAMGAGRKAFEGGDTLGGKWQKVLTRIETMFADMAKSPGVTAFKGVLDNIADIFDPKSDAGKRMLDRLNQLSDVFAKFLEPLTGADGKARMEAFFDAMARAVDKVVPGLKALAGFSGKLAGLGMKSISGYEMIGDLHLGDMRFIPPDPNQALTQTAKDRIMRQRAALVPTVNLTQHIDARGATKDDATHIANEAAKKARDEIADELTRIATQAGALGTPFDQFGRPVF
jgi:hypothetical protein